MPRCNIGHDLQATQFQHAGLWLDRYVRNPADSKQHGEHVAQTASMAEPRIYEHFFVRWEATLAAADAEVKIARTLGRLIVGLGNESVIETAITLHRTYGMPYIPGSALKGLAASYARQRLGEAWQPDGDAYRVMFGYAPDRKRGTAAPAPEAETNAAAAGYVTFFDALYKPNSGLHKRALHPDVMTVHHQDYYNKAQPAAPADWDDPNPVPFLTATGQFLIALAGPQAWVAAAFNILAHAFIEYGVGAKTNAGYGRMSLEGYEILSLLSGASSRVQGKAANASTGEAEAVDPDIKAVDDFIVGLAALQNAQVAGQINGFYQRWKALNVPASEKRRAAQAIIQRVNDAGREKASRDKAWYQEVLAAAL